MTRTVDEGFREFNRKLSLSKSESENLKKHRASIKVCLENNFGMNRFFKTGSIGNGTNISGYSDTDYFAGIPRVNLNNDSSVTLRKIKEVLQKRFINTNIYVNSPAIIVDFGTVASETTEIIPADFLKNENGVNIYDIPDKGNSWMKSSPKSCNEYVRKIDNDLKFKVKPLIRFVKAWKYYNNVPISSYFLEMKVAKYASNEDTILYLIDLKFFFKTLIDSGLSKIINPSGIGGYINPCISDTKKDEAISKIKTAYTRICNAYDSNEKGEIKNVFEWLDLVFDNKFPTYYN